MPRLKSTPITPRDVLKRIQHAALTSDGSLADLYAADAVHEWPFPFPGAPARLAGRDQIKAWSERIRAGGSRFRFERFDNVIVHETADPEVIIAEYDIHGQVTATGQSFTFSYVLVLRVRDGQIVHLRDYLNPLAMTRVAGTPSGTDLADGPAPAPPAGHADLLALPAFARVATVRPDGAPQNSVMWFAWDGARLNLTQSRRSQKFRNVTADPRVSVSLADPGSPYRSLEVRGVVAAVTADPDGAFFADLARRYGYDHPVVPSGPDRVVLSVRPTAFATSGPAATSE